MTGLLNIFAHSAANLSKRNARFAETLQHVLTMASKMISRNNQTTVMEGTSC